MKRLLLITLFLALPWMYAVEPAGLLGAPAIAVAANEAPAADAPKAPALDVNVNRTEKHVFSFNNPMMLAIAGGAVLLVVVIAMMSRGGGTTIIKEK